MLDVSKMVDAVLEAVDRPMRAFHERIKAVEARAPEKGEPGDPGLVGPPGEKGEAGEPGKDGAPAELPALPPELVEQLKSAAEMLAQPVPEPPIVAPATPATSATFALRNITGAVITRSGELAISYSDGSGERLGNVIGPQGEKGAQGERGLDGIGVKGDEGPPGRDGVSVMAAAIDSSDELVLTLSDGTVLKLGRVVSRKRT